ncbi:IclR family transcriptional regulator [Galbitalea soli]|uniref:IclR family transcriptional regulator n=1 Tax=Galbitalea soli TaxID=1268042 RepID=UPI0017CFE424|nr:DNA-binding IclR family transcriptional regulator [Galbitalea soli]
MAGRTSTPGATVLGRALGLLRAFTEDDDPLTPLELGRRAGLARSTAHRLVAELVALGMLDRLPDGTVTLGSGLWELGELAPLSLRMRERALPHLQTLYEATGENVHLAVLAGTDALYVARVTGTSSIPTVTRMGGRLPLHTTGVGRALLAGRDEEWLARYFLIPRERETTFSLTEEAPLRAEIERTRSRGYATTRQEMTLGNVSIAAALPVVAGLPPAALGVVTHIGRADEGRIAPLVVRTAAAIGAALAAH